MRFLTRAEAAAYFSGKTVALVGSGPGALGNRTGKVDGHDVVVRVNNYKLTTATGRRTDVLYSFFGRSIRKPAAELVRDGVKLCYCKCPNARVMESAWHTAQRREAGIDFRYIYQLRDGWWPCDVYIPSTAEFMEHFELMGRHIPTTGFSALLDILSYQPAKVYLTGFDFFQSGVHNVNERWRPGNPEDPIGHDPRAERAWFIAQRDRFPVECDAAMTKALAGEWVAPKVRAKVRPRWLQQRIDRMKAEKALREEKT